MPQTEIKTSENRCARCNRKLKDSAARYGWRCAQILGVAQNLNYAGDGGFSGYMQGVRKACEYQKRNKIDPSKVELNKFYEAFAKQILAAGMGDAALFFPAYADLRAALNPRLDKNGKPVSTPAVSRSLGAYLNAHDRADAREGRYTTTAFTDNRQNAAVLALQKELNEWGVGDRFGRRLKEDGVLGPKTQWAAEIGQALGDVGKGITFHSVQSHHGLYHIGGDTVFGVIDKGLGRVKNGIPVGEPIIRIDMADNATPTPHININQKRYPTPPELDHIKISEELFHVAKSGDKIVKAAKIGGQALMVVGAAVDAYELGSAVNLDLNDEDGKLGKKTVQTAARIGGSYAGGYGGAKLGAMGGAAIGTLICPGLGTVIGGVIGGIGGGIAGAMGGRALGEYLVDQLYEEPETLGVKKRQEVRR